MTGTNQRGQKQVAVCKNRDPRQDEESACRAYNPPRCVHRVGIDLNEPGGSRYREEPREDRDNAHPWSGLLAGCCVGLWRLFESNLHMASLRFANFQAAYRLEINLPSRGSSFINFRRTVTDSLS